MPTRQKQASNKEAKNNSIKISKIKNANNAKQASNKETKLSKIQIPTNPA